MAGLHALQVHGQVCNNDVKAKNILSYEVKPGGFWKYIINGVNFYVPNHGQLFIINDFGVSAVYNPQFCYTSNKKDTVAGLGSRFAMIIDGKYSPFNASKSWIAIGSGKNAIMLKNYWGNKRPKDAKKLPQHKKVRSDCTQIDIQHVTLGGQAIINCNTGAIKGTEIKFTAEQLKMLQKYNIPADSSNIDFYNHPQIIPPLEYRIDTQDAIRSFTGGHRYSQPGDHNQFSGIPIQLVKNLEPYLFNEDTDEAVAKCHSVFPISPKYDLAGYFILDFFSKHTNFTKKPTGNILATYPISWPQPEII